MDDRIALRAEELAVGYRGKALISGISFEVPKGNILTLIGPNGAGKSTILKTVTRQLPVISGSVRINGIDLKQYSQQDLAKILAVMLTERVKPEIMSCFDVAAMGRYPYTGRFGRLNDTDRQIIRETLRRVRAEEIADRDFSQISDGQQQRVLLARALAQQPRILVLDEPTSYLDIRHKIDLLRILSEEARQHQMTVIMSLHEIDLAEQISDLVLCIKDNKVWKFGPPQQIFQDDIIAELYHLEPGTYHAGRGSIELPKAGKEL